MAANQLLTMVAVIAAAVFIGLACMNLVVGTAKNFGL